MENYSLSSVASIDLEGIYRYGILNFGLSKAEEYLHKLEEHFQNLGNAPLLGRSASQFLPDLRQLNYQNEVIFYLPKEKGVLIVRVLGNKMDFSQHFGLEF